MTSYKLFLYLCSFKILFNNINHFMRKRFLWVLLLMLTGIGSWAQSFSIGGHRTVFDSRYNMWLCTIPQEHFGNDWTTTINYVDTLVTEIMIEGNAIGGGGTVTFEGIGSGKEFEAAVYVGDDLITGKIAFTWLPIVELNGNFGNEYEYGSVRVQEPDSALAEPLLAKVKWRGISTNKPLSNKRNYRIKFVNDDDSTKENHRFFGLRNDNSWILDAGQVDFLRVRNRVSTDLWLDMARRPWYSDTLPNARNGSRGQMVEVLLNGKYMGIYNMCEPIDRKQMKLKRYDEENNEFHGQLWMAYTWTRNVTMSEPTWLVPYLSTWNGFETKYPDPDEVSQLNWDVLYNAVWFANRADDDIELRKDSLSYYFDVPILQDYYIFIATLQALDNESKNIFYACYDTQDHPRLTIVPWDLDICLGQNYAPGVDMPDMVKPERHMDWVNHLPMVGMIGIEEYRDQVKQRYKELRKTVLNTDSLVNRYRSAIDELENCGAASREERRWSHDLDLARKTLDLSQEMNYVEDWIRRRMAFLDENDCENLFPPRPTPPIIYPKGDVNGDFEVNIADINALIDIILGGVDNSEGRSDVNEDGEVNISDINEVIDIILNS